MSTEQIAMLSREDITISGLNIIYWYFRGKEDISADMLVPEAERCLDMISEIPGNVPANEKKVLTEMLLQPYIKDDELLGSPKKPELSKCTGITFRVEKSQLVFCMTTQICSIMDFLHGI